MANFLVKSNKKRQLVIAATISLAGAVMVIVVWQARQHFVAIKQAIQKNRLSQTGRSALSTLNQKPIILVESPLNGEKVEEQVVNRRPLAVVIENHLEARPQRGLTDASVVYEAISEGGITRFLAIFGPKNSLKVGPVRSARTYFVDWVLEYDGLFAHVGGSQEVLQLIRAVGLKDLDQFGLGERAYQREPQTGKATEHTMFTSTEKLWEAATKFRKYDITANPTQPLLWKEETVADQRPKNQTITIQFSTDTYEVSWQYDHPANTYKRNLAGQPHLDGNNSKQLRAKSVIVQEVVRENSPTEDSRTVWKMMTVGSGPVKVIQDGSVIEGRWTKNDRRSRTRFFDKDGAELKLNRGPIWIEIVPPGTPIDVTTAPISSQ